MRWIFVRNAVNLVVNFCKKCGEKRWNIYFHRIHRNHGISYKNRGVKHHLKWRLEYIIHRIICLTYHWHRIALAIKWLIKRVISSATEVNKWNNNFIDFESVFNPPVQKLPKCLENFIKKQYKVLYNSSSSIVSSAARGQAKGQYEGNHK